MRFMRTIPEREVGRLHLRAALCEIAEDLGVPALPVTDQRPYITWPMRPDIVWTVTEQ